MDSWNNLQLHTQTLIPGTTYHITKKTRIPGTTYHIRHKHGDLAQLTILHINMDTLHNLPYHT